MLRRTWRVIDWRRYWQRVAFVSLMACFNTLIGALEEVVYGHAVRKQELHPEPVFVIGHPRTGTTHVHNMLAQVRCSGKTFNNAEQHALPALSSSNSPQI